MRVEPSKAFTGWKIPLCLLRFGIDQAVLGCSYGNDTLWSDMISWPISDNAKL